MGEWLFWVGGCLLLLYCWTLTLGFGVADSGLYWLGQFAVGLLVFLWVLLFLLLVLVIVLLVLFVVYVAFGTCGVGSCICLIVWFC